MESLFVYYFRRLGLSLVESLPHENIIQYCKLSYTNAGKHDCVSSFDWQEVDQLAFYRTHRRSWTRGSREQYQWVAGGGLELEITRLQAQRSNHSATVLPSKYFRKRKRCLLLVQQLVRYRRGPILMYNMHIIRFKKTTFWTNTNSVFSPLIFIPGFFLFQLEIYHNKAQMTFYNNNSFTIFRLIRFPKSDFTWQNFSLQFLIHTIGGLYCIASNTCLFTIIRVIQLSVKN